MAKASTAFRAACSNEVIENAKCCIKNDAHFSKRNYVGCLTAMAMQPATRKTLGGKAGKMRRKSHHHPWVLQLIIITAHEH